MFISKRVTIGGAAALAIVLLAGGSYAALESDEHGASRTEIAALLAAKQTPADAIRAAEAKAGGHAIEFGVEGRKGALAYEIAVTTAAGLSKVTVDLVTGAATSNGGAKATDVATQGGLPMPLATAVTAAERQTGGRALEARAIITGGQPTVVVTTVSPAQEPMDVVLAGADAHVVSTGKVQETTEADAD